MSARRERQRARRALGGVTRRPARNIASTALRRWVDAASHMPPRSMVDHTGGTWLGASRVIDRPARRRSERRSWRRLQGDARREFLSWGAE